MAGKGRSMTEILNYMIRLNATGQAQGEPIPVTQEEFRSAREYISACRKTGLQPRAPMQTSGVDERGEARAISICGHRLEVL